jgi:hypothetical protein
MPKFVFYADAKIAVRCVVEGDTPEQAWNKMEAIEFDRGEWVSPTGQPVAFDDINNPWRVVEADSIRAEPSEWGTDKDGTVLCWEADEEEELDVGCLPTDEEYRSMKGVK